MGSFDIFCMLCKGPFRIDDPFNEIRRRRINLNAPRGRGAGGKGVPDGIGYTRELISERDMEWVEKVQVLGLNPAVGICFISGIGDGNTQEFGTVQCAIGMDENMPRDDESDSDHDEEPLNATKMREFDVYSDDYSPFHPACFQIFAQALRYLRTGEVGGFADIKTVDKNVFYAALNIFYPRKVNVKEMELDYGELNEAWSDEQFWDCKPGEEPWVVNPVESPQISKYMSTLKTPPPTQSPTTLLRSHLAPFSKLADEITHEILLYLPHADFKSLTFSGLISPDITKINSFWKRKLFLDMPFLFDFPSEPQQRDWFTTYRELRRQCFATTLRAWKNDNGYLEVVVEDRERDLVLGLGNRRRIWEACEQVARAYLEERSGERWNLILAQERPSRRESW